MKKKEGLFLGLFIGIILIASFVSAQWSYNIRYQAQEAIRIIADFLSPFLEFLLGVSAFDQYFWIRVLLLILIFVIVLTVLKYMPMFKENPAVNVIASIIIAIFAAKFIGESEIITGILLPYGVLGIALTFIFPFLVFFFFVHKSIEAPVGRRAAWIFFAVIFFGLWMDRADQVGQISWIYFAGIVAVVLSIMFDPQIHRYFGLIEARAARKLHYHNEIARLRTKQNELRQWINDPTLKQYKKSYEEQYEDIEKRIQHLSRKEA